MKSVQIQELESLMIVLGWLKSLATFQINTFKYLFFIQNFNQHNFFHTVYCQFVGYWPLLSRSERIVIWRKGKLHKQNYWSSHWFSCSGSASKPWRGSSVKGSVNGVLYPDLSWSVSSTSPLQRATDYCRKGTPRPF